MLRALIFDVDGTLAETEELHRQAFNETFAENGLDWHWSVDDYRILLRTTGGKERMAHHRNTLGLNAPDDAKIARLHKIKTARYGDLMAQGLLDLRPGVRTMMARAREAGLALAIATTTNRPNVDALCEACWGCQSQDLFDVIAAGDEVKAKKPASDVYDLALERLGMHADEAVALEDSRNGVMSAKGAGLRVWVTPSTYTAEEDFRDADMVLRDLAVLDDLVFRSVAY